MALEGTLATLPFADLVQILGSARKTGTLVLTRGDQWKRLFFSDGMIMAVSSNDPDEWLGRTLVGLGKIDDATLERALARQRRENRTLGWILVDEGYLTPETLRTYLLDKAYGIVTKLIQWNDAQFRFEEFALPSATMIVIAISVEELLMEGFRRSDEVSRLREIVPSDDIVIEKTEAAPGEDVMGQTLTLALYRKLDEPRSVRQLRRELRTSDFALLDGIAQLMERGIVRRRVPRPPAPPPPNWLEQSWSLVAAGQFEAAVEMLRRGLAHDRENTQARRLLAQVEQSFLREVTRKEMPLDAVPIVVISLEDLGDRSLSPVEGFLLSRMDGETTVGELVEGTPLPPAEVLLNLRRLVRARLATLREPATASARPSTVREPALRVDRRTPGK